MVSVAEFRDTFGKDPVAQPVTGSAAGTESGVSRENNTQYEQP